MWCLWSAVLLVSCALVAAEGGSGPAGAKAGAGADEGVRVGAGAGAEAVTGAKARAGAGATTRAPPRTLDRQAAELAWRSWLQSPESGNPNAPPRRITTKSLFITPLVCPKGQRLDRNGCVQTVTVNKDEHERILLEQLNNLFTSAPSGDIVYDYGEDEPGPLQLSIPIGLDPQAAPLQAQEPSAQALDLQPNNVKVNKKEENKQNFDNIEAQLELLKLQHSLIAHNETLSSENTNVLNHDVLSNLMPPYDKPKRDSPVINATEIEQINNSTDEGQKEIVYGHVNVDPVLYDTENQAPNIATETEKPQEPPQILNSATTADTNTSKNKNITTVNSTYDHGETTANNSDSNTYVLKKDGDQSKLNPEHDYADIGEAIKLISRFADVTTDEQFSKDQKKYAIKDDSILGTRTKIQHRRNKPKVDFVETPLSVHLTSDLVSQDKMTIQSDNTKTEAYYRYPWQAQHSQTPPPDYPFRHLQDYWPGRSQVGGVYNTVHENPRRHHHTYPHFKTHGPSYLGYPGPYPRLHEVYPGVQYPYRAAPRHARPMRSHFNNQDLYSLLGLRHWFSSEGTSKR